MELGSFDGGMDGGYAGVGFVKISKISDTQDEFLYLTVYKVKLTCPCSKHKSE